MTSLNTVTARVPAKVNLQLSVGPPRADGYHELVTVFHAVSLFDEVTVAPADHDSVTVTGEGADSVPDDGTNLAIRAANALAQAVGAGCRSSPGLAIRISKRIPVAAGLAGGSADAAATLAACNELWDAGLSQTELSEVAAGLGSDVAFALLGGTAIGVGRGERVTPALATGAYHWVLAFARGGLSTPEVYAAHDRIRASRADTSGPASRPSGPASRPSGPASRPSGPASRPSGPASRPSGPASRPSRSVSQGRGSSARPGRPAPQGGGPVSRPALDHALMAALRSGDPVTVGPCLSNDLQPAAVSLRPDLRRTLAAGLEYGALGAIVSGSGPTCVYLAKDARHARDLAVRLTGAGVCRSVARVTGPAPGATVITAAAEQA